MYLYSLKRYRGFKKQIFYHFHTLLIVLICRPNRYRKFMWLKPIAAQDSTDYVRYGVADLIWLQLTTRIFRGRTVNHSSKQFCHEWHSFPRTSIKLMWMSSTSVNVFGTLALRLQTLQTYDFTKHFENIYLKRINVAWVPVFYCHRTVLRYPFQLNFAVSYI